MMTSAQLIETSVNVITNSPSQDYTHPDDHTSSTYGLFTIYMGKPVGLRFGQMVSKFPYWEIPFGTSTYHLQKSLPFTKKICMTATTKREGHKTKALINKTTTLHVRYSWYISLLFCAQLQREMTKFNVWRRTQTHEGEFSFFIIIIT